MTLAELIEPLDVMERIGNLRAEVLDVTDDSREVKPGSLFVAVRGERVDGHSFVSKAIEKGAVGIAVEEPIPAETCGGLKKEGEVASSPAVVRVKNSRAALGILAHRFYQNPSQKLFLVGVTGTNGKTTVTHLCQALLENGGRKAGLIGTVGYFIQSERYSATHTTPGSVVLQSLLAKMVDLGLDSAVLEVSSHALSLDRVAGCEFDTVVFTNLSQDHLDFHPNMEEYFQAKLRLFTELVRGGSKRGPKRAIVNVDDGWGDRIVENSRVPVWRYSIRAESDLQAKGIALSIDGTRFTALTPMGPIEVRSPLVGEPNVYNLLAAIGVGLQAGLSPSTLQQGFPTFKAVPGRFELVDEDQDFSVVVDYAHTEDALAGLLATARTLNRGRVLTVFGCGGDRDRGKRPKMGRVAAMQSDLVYLTSDNPRSEDPLAILREIEQGVLTVPEGSRAQYQVIPDRSKAIAAAVWEARSGDMVLIAGKGHEDYQLVGAERLHFDDRESARQALASLSHRGSNCREVVN